MSKKDDRYKALKKLEKKNGDIEIDAILDEAEDEDSVLHDYFEWDNGKAGHAHRRTQAKQLLREYKFMIVTEEVVRYSPRWISKADTKTPTFTNVDFVRQDKARSVAALEDEIARIIGACDRSLALADHFKLRTKFEEMLKIAAEVRGFLIEVL